jgi:DNA mismatch repair ATPase MutS
LPNKLYLGNRTLKQLNFSKDDKLYQIINRCKTPMGKRYFEMKINNPDSDPEIITKNYENLTFVEQNKKDFDFSSFYDIDRIIRKIQLKTIVPVDLYKLFISLESSIKLYNTINKDSNDINNLSNYINDNLDIDKIQFINSLDITESFFKKTKQFDEINKLQKQIDNIMIDVNDKKILLENLIDEGKYLKNKSIIKLEQNILDGLKAEVYESGDIFTKKTCLLDPTKTSGYQCSSNYFFSDLIRHKKSLIELIGGQTLYYIPERRTLDKSNKSYFNMRLLTQYKIDKYPFLSKTNNSLSNDIASPPLVNRPDAKGSNSNTTCAKSFKGFPELIIVLNLLSISISLSV